MHLGYKPLLQDAGGWINPLRAITIILIPPLLDGLYVIALILSSQQTPVSLTCPNEACIAPVSILHPSFLYPLVLSEGDY